MHARRISCTKCGLSVYARQQVKPLRISFPVEYVK
jgi:hypothetical protein